MCKETLVSRNNRFVKLLLASLVLATQVAIVDALEQAFVALPGEPGVVKVHSEFDDGSIMLAWDAPLRHGAQVENIELQYLKGRNGIADGSWEILPEDSQVGVISQVDQLVQTVRTRADKGTEITGGGFRLTFETSGHHDIRTESTLVTPVIPFDASYHEVEEAVESLSSIISVNAERGQQDWEGGFTWTITFTGRQITGKLPQLIPYDHTLNAPWSGIGQQVTTEFRSKEQTQVPGTLFCKDSCTHVLSDFEPGMTYAFRVREQYSNVKNEFGLATTWGPYSQSSSLYHAPKTPAQELQSLSPRVSVPELSSRNTDTLTVRFKIANHLWSPTWKYEVQYRKKDSTELIEWEDALVSDPGVSNFSPNIPMTATAFHLQPDTAYEFRARGVDLHSDISGPWVYALEEMRTVYKFIPPKPAPVSFALNPQELQGAEDAMPLLWDLGAMNQIPNSQVGLWAVEVEVLDVKQYGSSWERVKVLYSAEPSNLIHLSSKALTQTTHLVGSQVSAGGRHVNVFAQVATENVNPNLMRHADLEHNTARLFVIGLKPFHLYRFRTRLLHIVSEGKSSAWSDASDMVPFQTPELLRAESQAPQLDLEALTGHGELSWQHRSTRHSVRETVGPGDVAVEEAGLPDDVAVQAPMQHDMDYIPPAATGGRTASSWLPDGSGGHGLVVITFHLHGLSASPLVSVFHHTGTQRQRYVVPHLPSVPGRSGATKLALHVKVWGGAGGAGPAGRTDGGSGGFVQGLVPVFQGEVLEVAVGGGGAAASLGGEGGGQSGGPGSVGLASTAELDPVDKRMFGSRYGGGGGGASWVSRQASDPRSERPFLLVAGGGGGAGVASNGRGAQCEEPTSAKGLPSGVQVGRGGAASGGQGGGGGGFPEGGSAGAPSVHFTMWDEAEETEWEAVDGGGGEAGGCFIHPDVIAVNSARDDAELQVASVTHSSATIQWRPWRLVHAGAPPTSTAQVLEMATGPSSVDFHEVGRRGPHVGEMQVLDLVPGQTYRFRILVYHPRVPQGLVHGYPVSVTTFKEPENHWSSLQTWQRPPASDARCASAQAASHKPFPRSGHSATRVQQKMVMFGGHVDADLRIPEMGKVQPDLIEGLAMSGCVTVKGHTAETWTLDLETREWGLVPLEKAPSPRERHSSELVDDRVVVFGGRFHNASDLTQDAGVYPGTLHNDVWVLDMDLNRDVTLSFPTLTIENLEEEEVLVEVGDHEGMCVHRASVRVATDVRCTSELAITLSAPDPRVGMPGSAARQSSELEVQLFHGRNGVPLGPRGVTECLSVFSTVDFLDHAPGFMDVTASHQYGDGGESRSFKPFERLAKLDGVPVNGVWKLRVRDLVGNFGDDALDGPQYATGTVSASIVLELRPCSPSPRWRSVDVSSSEEVPEGRYGHSALVMENKMYVYGGMNGGGVLDDLWVLELGSGGMTNWYDENNLTGVWKRLNPVDPFVQPVFAGILKVSRFGLVAMNINQPDHMMFNKEKNMNIGIYDFIRRSWSTMNEGECREEHCGNGHSLLQPQARIGQSGIWVESKTSSEHERLVMFGGYDGIQYWDDIWELKVFEREKMLTSFRDLVKDQMEDSEKLLENELAMEVCSLRIALENGQNWTEGCGFSPRTSGNPPRDCSVEDLYGMAWCKHWLEVS